MLPYKKNFIAYFIMSVFLIVTAIFMQMFGDQKAADIVVSLLIGAATGIIATMVSCVLENSHRADGEIRAFETTACHILGKIYAVAKLDLSGKITLPVAESADAIYDYYQELTNILERMRSLIILPKRKEKLKEIYKQLEKVYCFISFDYKFPTSIEKGGVTNSQEVALFEALKFVKFAKQFDPQPILQILQRSNNNIMRDFMGEKEFFFIIFESDFNRAYQSEAFAEDMKQEIKQLVELYEKYDIAKVCELVDKMEIGNWHFSTKTSRRNQRELDKVMKEENNNAHT